MKYVFYSLLFLILSGSPSFCQDYVIIPKGDTLRGKVKILYLDRVDKVKVTQGKTKTTLLATQTREVFTNGEIYRPVTFQNTIRFMKLLRAGEYLSLYSFRIETQVTYGGRYLLRVDGEGTEVPNLLFKKNLSSFLEEDAELVEKIQKGEYGKSDLDKIIDEYNAYVIANTAKRQSEMAVQKVSYSRLELLEKLHKTVEGQPDFDAKKNAMALMEDLGTKLKQNQDIAPYMIETLKGYLSGVPAANEDLEKFSAAVK